MNGDDEARLQQLLSVAMLRVAAAALSLRKSRRSIAVLPLIEGMEWAPALGRPGPVAASPEIEHHRKSGAELARRESWRKSDRRQVAHRLESGLVEN